MKGFCVGVQGDVDWLLVWGISSSDVGTMSFLFGKGLDIRVLWRFGLEFDGICRVNRP